MFWKMEKNFLLVALAPIWLVVLLVRALVRCVSNAEKA